MEFRAARRSERDEVLDLLSLWYGDRDFFALYNQNDPAFRDELCLVAVEHGRIVSTVQIFDRRIRFSGQPIPLGGIGSVFSREDYRHKGVASALMKLSIDTMEREGFELSLLFAERLTFYELFGWRSITRKFSLLSDAHGAHASDEFVIDAFEPARDLADVSDIYRTYSGRFDGTAVRDDDYWRGSLVYAGNCEMHPPREYFVLCRNRDGSIAAYARACRLYRLPMVMELGYRSEAAMVSLFKFLGEQASGTRSPFEVRGDHSKSDVLRPDSSPVGPGMLVTHLAHDQPLQAGLAAAGCAIVHHEGAGPMWRVVAPHKLARRLNMPTEAVSEHFYTSVADDRCVFWTADRF